MGKKYLNLSGLLCMINYIIVVVTCIFNMNLFCQAFTTDFEVHWGQHPLRPELVESTYFIYEVRH